MPESYISLGNEAVKDPPFVEGFRMPFCRHSSVWDGMTLTRHLGNSLLDCSMKHVTFIGRLQSRPLVDRLASESLFEV